MLGSCVVNSPNGPLGCQKDVNTTKKTIADFFGKPSQNNLSSVKKPKNILGYFSKNINNSHVTDDRTKTSVGSEISEELPQVPTKNNVVKKNSLKKNPPTTSSSDKNGSNASSLDKKRKRVNKKVVNGDEDFVEDVQPKRFKSTDGQELSTNRNISTHSNVPLSSEKTPQNISNVKLKSQVGKIVGENVNLCNNDDNDFISKKDAKPRKEEVVGGKKEKKLPKRKYTKKNTQNHVSSSGKNKILKRKSKVNFSKNQQSNIGEGNELSKFECEKERKQPSKNYNKKEEKPDSKEIFQSDTCNSSADRESAQPGVIDSDTKSDLTNTKLGLTNTKSDLTDTKSDLTGTKSDLTGTKSDLTDTKSDLTDTKSDLTDTKSDLTDTKSDLTDTKSDLTDTKSDLTDTKSDLTGTKSDLTGTKSDLTGTKSDLTGTKSDLTGTKSDLTDTKSDLTDTKSDLTGTKSDLTGTKSDLTGTKSDLTGTKSDLTGTKSDLTGTKSDLTGTKSDLTGTKSDLTDTKSGLADTKSDLTKSCQSHKVESDEKDELNAMELSYEEFLLSETVTEEEEEESSDVNSAEISPEKASSTCVSVTMQIKEIPDLQRVSVVADIHPEPSVNNLTTANSIKKASKSMKAVLKDVPSSEVIKAKQGDINDIIVLGVEPLDKTDEVVIVVDEAPHKDEQKETSSINTSTKKVTSNRKSKPKPISKGKNKKSAVISNSPGVKCSQSTLNFEQGHLDLNSKSSNESSPVEKSKRTLKTDSKQPNVAAEITEKPQQNKRIYKKNKQKDLVLNKYKDKNFSQNSTKRVKSPEIPAVSHQPKKRKNKLGKRKYEKSSSKSSVEKNVKKAKVTLHEDKTAEVTEVKHTSTTVADGNVKENLDVLKKSSKSKLDVVAKSESTETALAITRKSLRLRERKVVFVPSDDLEILDDLEIIPPKEKENKVSPKTTLATKEKRLNNEKIPQKDGKLAPIFMKNNKKGRKKSKSEIEAEKLKRAFLMSGLPEEAKRQQQQTINHTVGAVGCDYAPFPIDSHVQQIEPPGAEMNPWDLPAVDLLLNKGREPDAEGNNTITTPPWNGSLNVVTESHLCNTALDHLKKFSKHTPLLESEIKTILHEISAANPSYPAQYFYEMALKRNKVPDKTDKIPAKSEIDKEVVNNQEVDGTAEENPKGKRKSKRSLGRRKTTKKAMETDSKADCQNSEKIEASSEEKGCDILWTEKYQPQQSSEIIGNSNNVKKLKSWLMEWKQRTDREARKLKKLLMKQKKSKKNKEEDSSSSVSWNEDESDFVLSTSDSEEDSMCNTKLLTGPQGIGKTASVYALAMELGYQVFEMNASSIRSGKKILTRLQEATQSHQVNKDKYDLTVSSQSSTDGSQKNPDIPSFSNFFKTSSNCSVSNKNSKSVKNSLSASSVAKKVGPSNKWQKIEKGSLPAAKKSIPRCIFRKSPGTGSWKKIDIVENSNLDLNHKTPVLNSTEKVSNRLNIVSTSLILFDEVDVVFEEDKGFWAAILQFMSSTKRPIILTATSADFSEQFIGSCEPLHFHTPSTKTLTSHFQTLCLAENVVTKASEISDMVTHYSGDIRSCLLALQFWVDSGASGAQVNIPLSQVSRNNHSNNNKSDPDLLYIETTEQVTAVKQEKQLELKDTDVTKQEFAAHQYSLESYLAIDAHQFQLLQLENVSSKTSIVADQLDSLARICRHYYQQNFYLCHQIFLSRLCLPQAAFPSFDLSLQALKKKATKPNDNMQRLKRDFYDSDTSCDETISQQTPDQTDDHEVKLVKNCSEEPASVSKTDKENDLVADQKTSPSNLEEEKTLPSGETSGWKTLRGVAKFYECCSDIDIFLTTSCCLSEHSANLDASRSAINSHSSLTAGLWDEFPIVSNELRYCQTFTEQTLEIATNWEVRSYLGCRQDISSPSISVDSSGQLLLHDNTSMSPHQHFSGIIKSQPKDRSLSLARQKAVENVIHNLPLTHSLQANLLFLDYFPELRKICRTEKVRQLAKLKRRFFHYFDNINLPLKESTLNILSSDFM